MANGIENAGVNAPKKIKVRGKEMSVTPTYGVDTADVAANIAKGVLAFLPGSGEAIAAEDYFKGVEETKEAVKEKDYGKAAGTGLMTLIAGAGTLPIVGPIARGMKGIYKGSKNAYNAFRASRMNDTASDIVTGTTNLEPGTNLVKLDEKTGTYIEPRTSAPVGDVDDAALLQFSEGTPFYSRGLEVVDNVDYANYNKTGGIEKIRPSINTKDQSLSAGEWRAMFKKHGVTNQELKESGVLDLLDTYQELGERIPASELRDLFLVNPAYRVKVKTYGGKDVNDLANIRAQTKRLESDVGNYEITPENRNEILTQGEDIQELREVVADTQIVVMDSNKSGAEIGRWLENEFDKIENLYNRMNNNGTFDRFPVAKETFDRFIKEFGEGGYLNPNYRALEGHLPRAKHQDSSYTLSGGRDYEEKVLVGPEIQGQPVKVFSGHFPEKNPVAHIRYDTRTRYDIGGNDMNDEILFIQEMQSDIHQKARDIGYNPNPYVNNEKLADKIGELSQKEYDEFMLLSSKPPADLTKADIKKLESLGNKFNELTDKQLKFKGGQGVDDKKMPFSPFQDDEYWGDYGIKLMAKQAFDNGQNWLAIAPADMVSARDGSIIEGMPAYGNAMFYGASDGKSIKARTKGYGNQEKTVKKGVVPKIFERLSKLNPNRPPLEVKQIWIKDEGGELYSVYAMEIDDRFDTVFPMYKNQGGIVSLLRK